LIRLNAAAVYDAVDRRATVRPDICFTGDPMVPSIPFLMSPNDAGVVALVIFLASSIIFGIPVFANRGRQQLVWLGVVGFVLTVEIALLVTFVVLTSTGDIHPSFS
jgi:hypothetical protein